MAACVQRLESLVPRDEIPDYRIMHLKYLSLYQIWQKTANYREEIDQPNYRPRMKVLSCNDGMS